MVRAQGKRARGGPVRPALPPEVKEQLDGAAVGPTARADEAAYQGEGTALPEGTVRIPEKVLERVLDNCTLMLAGNPQLIGAFRERSLGLMQGIAEREGLADDTGNFDFSLYKGTISRKKPEKAEKPERGGKKKYGPPAQGQPYKQ